MKNGGPGPPFSFEVAAVLELVPGPDHLLQHFLLAAVAAVHVRVQHLDQRLVALADLGLGHALLGVENVERAPLGRRQPATDHGAAGVLRGVLAQQLLRVRDPVPGPAHLLLRTPEGFRRPFPDRRILEEALEFLFRLALEVVPVQVVLAHVILAEPEIVVEHLRAFRRPILAGLGAALVVAFARRGLECARHPALALGPTLLVGGCRDVEAEGIGPAHVCLLSFSHSRVAARLTGPADSGHAV
ncbi:hypothetical protein SDC9_20605 [bioreactor metagenome]|uniref:Uncharacterized protein n=1 Tax=bioreactor metagenome TaxID=1076179 RepID=A0A644U762_9ZZZZ